MKTLYIIKGREVSVTINEKGKKGGRVRIVVTRTFGNQNLIEIYSDYVAKKIKELLRQEREKNDEENS